MFLLKAKNKKKNSKITKFNFKNSKKIIEEMSKTKNEQIFELTETNFYIMEILLTELINIKNALIFSSAHIQKVFKQPLLHLKQNVNFFLKIK